MWTRMVIRFRIPLLCSSVPPNTQLDQSGQVVVKNQDAPSAPAKSRVDENGDLVENKTVTQGETVCFEVTGKVPSIAGMDNTYTYTLEDYAGEGLPINLNSIEAKSGNNSLDKGTTGASGDYTVSPDGDTVPGKGENAQEATFTVTVNYDGLKKLTAGDDITLSYSAVVTDATKSLANKAIVSNNGKPSKPGEEELTSTPLSFTKVGAKGVKLANVKFSIKVAEDVQENTAVIPDGYDKDVTSNEEGEVSFAGLADGTYTITEGENPNEGYVDMGLSFDVTITNGHIKVSNESASKWVGLDYDLVIGSDTDIQVQNIKNITQLPLTGAAGTALFTVLGLLIAGAGVTVYMKSRSVKRALRG